jgi:hypothetical protein
MKKPETLKKLVMQLENMESWQVWRDEVAKPIIEQMDYDLLNVLEMDEATLKAKIMYRNLVKSLFYNIFDSYKAEIKAQREQKKINN